MIKSFKIVNHMNQILELDIRKPEDTGFLVSSVVGLTYPNAEISTSDIALFDGSILGNRRVGGRNIVITLIFYEDNRQKLSVEDLRHKCYRFFPVKEELTLYITNDSGTYWIKGYIETNEINIFTKQEGAQISIICPDPYFVRQGMDINNLVSKIVPNFSFPCSFEFVGEPVIGYPNLYDGPFVIVPGFTDLVIPTELSYTYGDIIIAKHMLDYELNEGGGNTAIVKGDDSIPDYTPGEPEDANWTPYQGPYNFIPQTEDIILPTAVTYITDDITVKSIPIERRFVSREGHLDTYEISIG